MIDRAAGVSSAAPSPWPARAAISAVAVGARPLASDAAVNTARPARKIRRLPTRSAARPPTITSPPLASTYAVTTHCRPPAPQLRDPALDGRATFTPGP